MAAPPSVPLKIEVQNRHLRMESSFPECRTEVFVLRNCRGQLGACAVREEALTGRVGWSMTRRCRQPLDHVHMGSLPQSLCQLSGLLHQHLLWHHRQVQG